MSEQIFQVGVKGLIQNNSGRILMVHIPEWSGNKAHWDLPGGRMDKDENLLDTLKRELIEEIGQPYIDSPSQLMAFLTNITISVGSERVPLFFVVYKVKIADTNDIHLDPNSAEDKFDWFEPQQAAKEMSYKFSDEFCQLVSSL